MKSLSLILQNAPNWATIEARGRDTTKIVVTPPAVGGGFVREFLLELARSEKGGVCVSEQEAHRQLPSFCMERHINPETTFCVYYGSEEEIADDTAASLWWKNLAVYLNNQIYAEAMRVWPLEGGLSHGEAADHQIEMEKIAERLGWLDEVLRGIFRAKGWLAENLPKSNKRYDRVHNSHAPCPRGCTRKHGLLRRHSCAVSDCASTCRKHHKPILRVDCPNRKEVEALVLHEHKRRKIERLIVAELKTQGKVCCGTMKNCPLF